MGPPSRVFAAKAARMDDGQLSSDGMELPIFIGCPFSFVRSASRIHSIAFFRSRIEPFLTNCSTDQQTIVAVVFAI